MNPMNCRCLSFLEMWVVAAGMETLVIGIVLGYFVPKLYSFFKVLFRKDAIF